MSSPLERELLGGGGLAQPDMEEIQVPSSAGLDDPRIYIGPDDPILDSINQDAGIVLYYSNGRAYTISVERSGGDPLIGQLHIAHVSPEMGYSQIIDVTAFNATNVLRVDFGAGMDPELDDFRLFNHSMARGYRTDATDLNNSGAVAVETVVLTTPSITFAANRAYSVELMGGTRNSTAGANGQYRIRKNNLAGVDLGEYYRVTCTLANVPYLTFGQRILITGTSVTCAIALTLNASAGAAIMSGLVSSPRSILVKDIGDANDYINYPLLS